MNMHNTQPFVYEQASEKLIDFIPELENAYRTEIEWWGTETPGPHIIYEDILNPHIDRLFASGDDNGLRRVFDFIEILSTAEDNRLRELVAAAILEPLTADGIRMSRARRYMGPATLRILSKVQQQ